MAEWKYLLRHVTANVNSGGSDSLGAEQVERETEAILPDSSLSVEQNEKIEFALEFVDTLSTLEAALHTSDDPEEIAHGAMRVACDFYQADWCGFLTVDLDLGIWTSFWWYNTQPTDRTKEFTDEFESAAKLGASYACLCCSECHKPV